MGLDDEFMIEAKRAQAEEAEKDLARKNKKVGNFVEIKWTGVTKTPETLVLRFLGEKPDLNMGNAIPAVTPTDARVINMARLISDNGKQMDLILPLYSRDSNHFMWRVYDRVNTIVWKKAKDDKGVETSVKSYPNETKFPDIFNIVNFSGLTPDNLQRKFGLIGRGWKGKELLIVNVIDRALKDWHNANKHTCLLAKKITFKDQVEFVDKGIPAYGTTKQLLKLRSVYGNWESFDIGFERTGQMDNPGECYNASRTPEKIEDPTLASLISSKPLSEAEKKYERYDLDKLFAVTSYTKIYNQLHLTIEKIDASFGTFYADELKKLAEAEVKVEAEAEVKVDTDGQDAFDGDTPDPVKVEVVTRAVKPVVGQFNITDLPGFKTLTVAEQGMIVSAEAPLAGTKNYRIVYSDTATRSRGECPECSAMSPGDWGSCPSCGSKFS